MLWIQDLETELFYWVGSIVEGKVGRETKKMRYGNEESVRCIYQTVFTVVAGAQVWWKPIELIHIVPTELWKMCRSYHFKYQIIMV